MKRYDKSHAITRQPGAPDITRTSYSSPLADEAAPILGMAFVALFVSAAVLFVGNVGAMALSAWTGQVFQAVALASLVPWLLLIIGYAQELLVFAWPRLERVAGRDLDKSGGIGDPHSGSTVLTPDRVFFIETICRTGAWTQRDWRGIVLPSTLVCDNDLHKVLITPLEDAGVFTGRKEGAKGQMVTRDPSRIMEMLTAKN